MDYLVSYGEWLRERREALRLTRPELADCVGCSVSGLRKIETGERRPSRQLAELLAQCLRIAPEEHLLFLDVARGIRPVARLGRPEPRPPVPQQAPLAPPTGASTSKLAASPLWNLPAPTTPLLGREAELATLARLLRDPGCRLLTLVGPGGIGKTRLAIEAACYNWERFTDGVFFVSLATTDAPEFIVPAIAQAMGLNFSGPAEPRSQLTTYVRNKNVLLLLDNLEHLLEGVEELTVLLASSPGIRLLVTSRERLALQEEWVLEVQGLPVPHEDMEEELEQYSSFQLFLQRARRARTDFELSLASRPDVARICRLVEGMPLAIELAAAWVPVLSVREIADEIERGLDLMTSSARDVPERQRSLRAAFEHSWRLLTNEERRALRQLSTFRGGFLREAAEIVAGASLPLLSTLIAKSFLRRSTSGRFGVHELIRQYAAERLHEDPQEELATYLRHCHHYTDLLVRLDQPLKSAERAAAIEELMTELDNVRAAWQWATEHQKLHELRRMAPSLYWFYDTRNLFDEGETAFRRAADTIRSHERRDEGPEEADAIGYLLGSLGFFNFRLGRHQEAFEYLRESWTYVSQYDDLESHFHVHVLLGFATWAIGDIAEARRVLNVVRQLALQIGSPWHAAIPSVLLGTVAHAQGAYEDAYRQLSDALELWRAAGDPRGLSFALASLGATTFALGKVDEAEALLRDSVVLNEEIDDRWSQTYALGLLAQVLCAQERCAEAVLWLQQSLSLSQEIGDSLGEAQTWVSLGDTLGALGKDVEAAQAYHKAWTMAHEGQMTAVLIDAAVGSAETYQRQDHAERALAILLRVLPRDATGEESKARAKRLYAAVTSQLSAEEIEAATDKAERQSLETLMIMDPAFAADTEG